MPRADSTISDNQWRAYERQLVGEFLAASFDPNCPPTIVDLLERDRINPLAVSSLSIRKVDRFAPIAAAEILIGNTLLVGHSTNTQFCNLSNESTLTEPIPKLSQDIQDTHSAGMNTLYHDSQSPLRDILHVFQARTINQAKRYRPFEFAREDLGFIARGGDLNFEVRHFLTASLAAAQRMPNAGSSESRHALLHHLVSYMIGRAAIELAEFAHSDYSWTNQHVNAATITGSRIPTLTNRSGDPLFPTPQPYDQPMLKCPAHRDLSQYDTNAPRGSTQLRRFLHAAINAASSRGILN